MSDWQELFRVSFTLRSYLSPDNDPWKRLQGAACGILGMQINWFINSVIFLFSLSMVAPLSPPFHSLNPSQGIVTF